MHKILKLKLERPRHRQCLPCLPLTLIAVSKTPAAHFELRLIATLNHCAATRCRAAARRPTATYFGDRHDHNCGHSRWETAPCARRHGRHSHTRDELQRQYRRSLASSTCCQASTVANRSYSKIWVVSEHNQPTHVTQKGLARGTRLDGFRSTGTVGDLVFTSK